MSVKVMSRIWQESRQHGGALLVLLAIGDFSDDNGMAYPSVETLAQKARLSESQTHRILRQLQTASEIEVLHGEGPKGCNLFRVKPVLGLPDPPTRGVILLPVSLSEGVAPMRPGGSAHAPRGVAPVAPEPSIEPLMESPDNNAVWPVWFSLLWGVEGFKTSFETAEAWRIKTEISEDLAERKAYRVREWWLRQPKKRRSEGDPYMTWQGWCRDERSKEKGQHAKFGRDTPGHEGENDIQRAAREQTERLADPNYLPKMQGVSAHPT